MNKILYKLIHKLIYKWLEFRGMNNFISKQYAKELLYDISTKIPLKDKFWSYKHGFLAVDTKFCGITKDNYKDYLTNREYFNAFPLNNIYKKWIDDKLTTRMVLDSFKEYLPKYYFHILENGEILKSIDCPVGYTGTFDDVIHLLQEKKELVFKPNSESGGVGFCKLTYNEGTYSLNSNKVSKKKMIDILMNSNDYVVTEYLHMHKEIKKINPDSTNTFRVMVIREKGKKPIITNAFHRFGTKRSGNVDNLEAGGIESYVDIDTGEFRGGMIWNSTGAVHISTHPDTKMNIEGVIPNWQFICRKIIEISQYISEVTFMGYDILVCEHGFKIIEINSHQGLIFLQRYEPFLIANNPASGFFREILNNSKYD